MPRHAKARLSLLDWFLAVLTLMWNPQSGRHAAGAEQPGRRPEFGADERYADELHTMSGELHPELSEEITQEIAADSLFERTQDANDRWAYERLMDGGANA